MRRPARTTPAARKNAARLAAMPLALSLALALAVGCGEREPDPSDERTETLSQAEHPSEEERARQPTPEPDPEPEPEASWVGSATEAELASALFSADARRRSEAADAVRERDLLYASDAFAAALRTEAADADDDVFMTFARGFGDGDGFVDAYPGLHSRRIELILRGGAGDSELRALRGVIRFDPERDMDLILEHLGVLQLSPDERVKIGVIEVALYQLGAQQTADLIVGPLTMDESVEVARMAWLGLAAMAPDVGPYTGDYLEARPGVAAAMLYSTIKHAPERGDELLAGLFRDRPGQFRVGMFFMPVMGSVVKGEPLEKWENNDRPEIAAFASDALRAERLLRRERRPSP